MTPLLHTVRGAADRLNVSESSIWRLLRQGQLRRTSVLGRTMLSEDELQRFVTEATKALETPPLLGAGPDLKAE
jgi:excisionase family DNA binding protein